MMTGTIKNHWRPLAVLAVTGLLWVGMGGDGNGVRCGDHYYPNGRVVVQP